MTTCKEAEKNGWTSIRTTDKENAESFAAFLRKNFALRIIVIPTDDAKMFTVWYKPLD